MITLDLTQIVLKHLITHHVGNKLRDEKFSLSSEVTIIENDTKDFLLKYFLLPVKAEEFYSFTHSVKLEMNDIYSIVESVFLNQKKFISFSQSIVKLLYEQSMHPKIKEGELNITYFSNVILDDEVIDAVGIFKSETDVPFIKMKNENSKFNINHDYGFEIKGMDKGCIIFNTDSKNGYKILIVDNANKSSDAQYWKDDFLKVKPISNGFHYTNQFLGVAKNFVTKQLSEEFQVSKADKIDLLNRSMDYFKTHESFDKKEFETEVFHHPEIIKSFQNYNNYFKKNSTLEIDDSFEISQKAVKNQARLFKSVLKLDKNFHIYIHGDKELIEKGVEKDGRKYYKIYYNNES